MNPDDKDQTLDELATIIAAQLLDSWDDEDGDGCVIIVVTPDSGSDS